MFKGDLQNESVVLEGFREKQVHRPLSWKSWGAGQAEGESLSYGGKVDSKWVAGTATTTEDTEQSGGEEWRAEPGLNTVVEDGQVSSSGSIGKSSKGISVKYKLTERKKKHESKSRAWKKYMPIAHSHSPQRHQGKIFPHLIKMSSHMFLFSNEPYLCLCLERMGKVAPSVFSGVRTGTETSLAKPAPTKTSGASVFSK